MLPGRARANGCSAPGRRRTGCRRHRRARAAARCPTRHCGAPAPGTTAPATGSAAAPCHLPSPPPAVPLGWAGAAARVAAARCAAQVDWPYPMVPPGRWRCRGIRPQAAGRAAVRTAGLPRPAEGYRPGRSRCRDRATTAPGTAATRSRMRRPGTTVLARKAASVRAAEACGGVGEQASAPPRGTRCILAWAS